MKGTKKHIIEKICYLLHVRALRLMGVVNTTYDNTFSHPKYAAVHLQYVSMVCVFQCITKHRNIFSFIVVLHITMW